MRFKRFICCILAAFFISYAPISSYAAATSIAISAGSYVINLILNACGIDFSLSSITTILGEWQDYQDYMDKGANGELGLFSQYLYNQSVDTSLSADLRQDALNQIEVLNQAVNSVWGATVSGVKTLISALKSWVSGLTGYGTDTLIYNVDVNTASPEWTTANYVSVTPYTLRTLPSYTYPAQYISSNAYVFTSFSTSPYAGYATVRNWYKPESTEIFGFYDVDTQVVHFYIKDGDSYKSYNMFYYFDYVSSAGAYKYTSYDTNYGNMTYVSVDAKHVGTLPFTVFRTQTAVAHYCQTGVKTDVVEAGKVAIPADAVNVDVQKAALKSIPDTITLPATAEAAATITKDISSAVVAADETVLKDAIQAGGLAIDWGRDDADTDADAKSDLAAIAGKVDTLPADIAAELEKRTETDGETARRRLTLSGGLMDKFPFCIPFDVIYLVQTLAADKVTPVFEIPIKFNYEQFSYDETFRFDFSEIDELATILRIMLDLLFCAQLLSVTRHLIRG